MSVTTATAPKTSRGRVLTVWTPEDKAFWEREGDAIAKLNLWISVPALFLAFAIWVMSPFVGFLMADARAARWSSPARTTLHGTMLLVTAATLAIYGVVALGPPRPKPASFFLVVPPASVALLAVAVSIAASRSRRASR